MVEGGVAKGACMVKGVCMAKGACVVKGAHMVWEHVWWGPAWQGVHVWRRGVCLEKGVCMAVGYECQGVCMAGGVCGRGRCMAGETTTAADGTHPTGMHSCFIIFQFFANVFF